MQSGRARKRMIKLGRRVPLDEVRLFIHRECLEGPSHYFLLLADGYELIRGWHPKLGVMELSMEDEVFYSACTEYLKSIGLVFNSKEDAMRYAATDVFPKLSKV